MSKKSPKIEWLVEERIRPGLDWESVDYVHRMTSFACKEKAMDYQRHLADRKKIQSRLLPKAFVTMDFYPSWECS